MSPSYFAHEADFVCKTVFFNQRENFFRNVEPDYHVGFQFCFYLSYRLF